MNGPRYKQEKKIFKLYSNKIQQDCIKAFEEFLNLYTIAYEDENSLMRNSFLTEDPLPSLNEIVKFNTEYYLQICAKLEHYVKNYLFYLKKPKYIANIIAYYAFALEYGLFGMEINKKNAFQYYKLSAQNGSPFGTFRLAQCYEKGEVCAKNKYKALEFYRCAAKLGSIHGLHTYGTILLQNNFDIDEREEIAFFYLKIGINKAIKSYPYVFYDYARYIEFKLSDNEITFEVDWCFKVYFRGAQNECPNCQYRVAQCFEFGELNVNVDLKKAFSYYKSAAFNGHIDAQVKIAQTLIEKGDKTQTNYNLAYNYAIKAAIKGDCKAIKYMTIFYKNGLGIKKNIAVSNWWEKILFVHLKEQKIVLNLQEFEILNHLIIIPLENRNENVFEEYEGNGEIIKVM